MEILEILGYFSYKKVEGLEPDRLMRKAAHPKYSPWQQGSQYVLEWNVNVL